MNRDMHNNTNIEFVSEKSNKIENKNFDDLNLDSNRVLNPSSNPTSPLLDPEQYPLNDLNKLSTVKGSNESLVESNLDDNKPPPLASNPEIDDFDEKEPVDKEAVDEPKEDGERSPEDIDDLIKDVFDLSSRAGGLDDAVDGVAPMKPAGGFPPSFPGGISGLGAGFGVGTVAGEDGMITLPNGERIPDVNVYQHKKTLAQGMMDLALFSANANQLRYVMESASSHPYYYPGIVLIATSLILQVLVGVGLLWNSRYNVRCEKQICVANKINNFTVIGIFMVTIINVFISAFGVAQAS